MTHPPDCECGAYACELRKKAPQVGIAGMARHNGKAPAPHRYNQWEKGTAGETRPDGSRMPYLDKHGGEIPIKKYSEGAYRKGKAALDRARALNTQR